MELLKVLLQWLMVIVQGILGYYHLQKACPILTWFSISIFWLFLHFARNFSFVWHFCSFFWLGHAFFDNFWDSLGIFLQKWVIRSKKSAKTRNECEFLSKNDKPIQNMKPKTKLKLDKLFVNGNKALTGVKCLRSNSCYSTYRSQVTEIAVFSHICTKKFVIWCHFL